MVALAVVVRGAFVLTVVMPGAIFLTLMALPESESFRVLITCNSKTDHYVPLTITYNFSFEYIISRNSCDNIGYFSILKSRDHLTRI